MLNLLTISNFVLIDSLSVSFAPGFTSITGETGAGKSIFVGALSMLLGRRSESSLIKEGATKSIIEGHFVDLPQQAKGWLIANELYSDDDECILRRELSASGRGRFFINDTPVSLGQLSELAALLLDIHSQHQNLSLTGSSFQLRMVDKMLSTPQYVEEYALCYKEFREAQKQLEQLTEDIKKSRDEYDYNLFKYNELSAANLQADEEIELGEKEQQLRYADEIKGTLWQAASLLEGDETGSITLLQQSEHALDTIAHRMSSLADYSARLHSCRIELRDIHSDLQRIVDDIEADPQLLDGVTARLDLLNTLLQKYHVANSRELIALKDHLEGQIHRYEDQDVLLEEAQKSLNQKRLAMDRAAQQLTHEREQTALSIAQHLTEVLRQLELPHARIDIRITPTNTPTPTGYDQVDLLFSANSKNTLYPIGEVASGGEIARVMLAVKAMLAERDQLPTILFDEVDTGVSGRVADCMGKILRTMGQHLQVIAITHLPQIAARSQAQMAIAKRYDEQQVAHTELTLLTDEQRENEIARLISGDTITDAGRTAARELLTND